VEKTLTTKIVGHPGEISEKKWPKDVLKGTALVPLHEKMPLPF